MKITLFSFFFFFFYLFLSCIYFFEFGSFDFPNSRILNSVTDLNFGLYYPQTVIKTSSHLFHFFVLPVYQQLKRQPWPSPVDTRRRFNVYTTSYRRLIDVETTSCVYWEGCKLDFDFPS